MARIMAVSSARLEEVPLHMDEIPHHATEDRLIVRAIVDNPIFTDVTQDGEMYTTYRIVRIIHAFQAHPSGWTHLAEVEPLRSSGRLEAFLHVQNRTIERSKIQGSDSPSQ